MRRMLALITGIAVLFAAALCALLSVESLGLVGSDASYNLWLVTVALLLYATTGFVVARVAGHQRWARTGIAAVGAAAALLLVSALATGSLFFGALFGGVTMLAPALLGDGGGPLAPRDGAA